MVGATTLADSRRSEPRAADGAEPAGKGHHRPDIQGLRAVAVGLVVAAHVTGWPAGGFIGVDVFFVISGFLITGLLVRERTRTGGISFRGFYARRARRLLPAALVTLAATTAAAYAVFLDGRFQETVTDVIWAALFSANINFAVQGTDYFELTAAPSMVQHFWSLAVEEQFYLVWPALILLAFAVPLIGTRRRRVVLWGLLGAVTAASFAWSVHATSASPTTAYFSTFTRAWELGVGALVAVSATQLHRLPAPLRAALAWGGLAVVLAAAFVVDDRTPFPGTAAAVPVLGTAALLAWGATPGGPGGRWLLGSAPAGFVGAISYSLYLWHWPVLIVAGVLLAADSPEYYAAAVGVSLALATVSYYCIEQPVLHSNWLLPGRPFDGARARPVFRRAGLVGLAAAVVATATVVAVVVLPQDGDGDAQLEATRAAAAADAAAVADGMPPPTALQRDIQAATFATEWPEDLDPSLDELPGYLTKQWDEGCLHISEKNVDTCRWGDADASQSVAVLGDSFAAAWIPALREALVPSGWAVQSLTFGLCPNIAERTLFQGEPFVQCVEHREWAIEHLLENPPTVVVLSHSWRAQLDEGSDRREVYQQGLTDVVRRVQASGARVVILGAPPGSESLQTCPTSLNGPDDCLGAPADTFATQVESEREVAALTGARSVDPEAWFCVDSRCPTFVGNTPVYGDGLHLTAEYARRIAPEVGAAVLQP
ncbi:Peptidoglycan/LPS O-acetylase OafA/YrhL, contains acyltransferase and SGNH-hydrolase domains [Blastococcus aggregatus]|uniref:Peptidoglycan/LPS O-acetylase OafA/YrhL, contains acyltransferase and SGNH-hydrolase domains n=1 Tax=Blastococcus aggregatus TaxID=38502 RepID=A0A285UYQ5_9ACTN|nr:acyltransferase family protein [Blastococcus aggregatus]SOC46923.1 Peptidoglycan/LPS O-acetylase OafA/YrhL, contains acyltransferase and SGNH-hydrolase domains [Blastococcus aggregatus]